MKRAIDVDRILELPAGLPALPAGWLGTLEARILYMAARKVGSAERTAAILEVGSWIGRSSCVLAYGVRDCDGLRPRYDIVDYGIASDEEWVQRFGTSIFQHKDAKKFAEVIFFPGGTGAVLKKNLIERGLSEHVCLIVLGDVRHYSTTVRYDLIFCDAAHGEAEIRKNIPLLKDLLREDFILICDDIHTNEERELVAELTGSEQSYLSNEVNIYTKFGVFTRGQAFREFLG